MNKQSLFFTCLVAIVATALMLIVIQYLAKRQRIRQESDGKIIPAYTVWVITLLGTFFIFLKTALEQIENDIEVIIYSKTINDTFIQVMQRITIYTGFTFIFTLVSYYIVHNLLKLIFGTRNDSMEIEGNNVSYFIVKGITLFCLVISLIEIFEHFLRWFAPTVDMPFYH